MRDLQAARVDEIALVVEMNKSLSTENARLRAEIDRLRAALTELAEPTNWLADCGIIECPKDFIWIGDEKPWQLAADALRGEGGEA